MADVTHPGTSLDVPPDGSASWWQRRARPLAIVAIAVLFTIALLALHRALAGVTLDGVRAGFDAVPLSAVALAAVLTALSYFVLTFYDVLGLRHLGRPLPYAEVALTSFVAFAISNNIGLALVSGGSIRYRLYSAMGLSAAEIAVLVTMVTFTFTLGVLTLAALVVALDASALSALTDWPQSLLLGAGIAMLVLLLAYVIWSAVAVPSLRWRGWAFTFPPLGITVAQLVLATLDLLISAAVLYVLMPESLGIDYPTFVGIYLLAIAASLVSHVPGGVGVFEAVMVHALPAAPVEGLLGALLVYRCIYYLGPLLVAAGFIAVREAWLHAGVVGRLATRAEDRFERLAPVVFGVVVLLSGAVLLVSGATPPLDRHLWLLREWLPLPVLEVSHLLASVVGLGLLVISRGLFRRLDAAWQLTMLLLLAGMMLSLLKGFDYDEAVFLGLVMLALYAGRGAFYRRAALLSERFTTGWLVTVLVIVICTVWMGLFAYKHVEYANELWWEFSFEAGAPRYLRATLLVIVLGTGLALTWLLRPVRPQPETPDTSVLARACELACLHGDSNAGLVAVGDKRLLFNEQSTGFLMYQTRGQSWIALGDPVATDSDVDGLVWRFRELCDAHGGRTVFYQIGTKHLPLYLDLGLSMIKLGEEARVPLGDFSLEGSARAELRQTRRRGQRDGLDFCVVDADRVVAVLAEMRAVSDAWLALKHVREKGFSLGYFDERYLRSGPVALVRNRSGSLVAFANLLLADGASEISVDMMRHAAGAPAATMDFLFIELFLWGQARGYQTFNLGMAPLSGLEQHRLAPIWHRVGNLLYRHGELFYNFEGLRRYKQKFRPVWEPRYLAAPGGADMARALVDVSLLINEGPR
ncbi:MAG: bifunctional lysylphosphatidylglycerol flippase/synthetase MprF [Gammaproteobacteria bacterium]|nr:bifunctional lysylphosphatidylglycerol flippase/synthetase MprF [Gammaproteobacteria bacterium]